VAPFSFLRPHFSSIPRFSDKSVPKVPVPGRPDNVLFILNSPKGRDIMRFPRHEISLGRLDDAVINGTITAKANS
jgi:hypothetical protein